MLNDVETCSAHIRKWKEKLKLGLGFNWQSAGIGSTRPWVPSLEDGTQL